MDRNIQTQFENLHSTDRNSQFEAFQEIMKATEEEVDWAYEVWEQLIDDLDDKDPHHRSRAAQFLAHLAISDPDGRMLTDFSAVWAVTKDEKFVTARHSLQAIWRVGLAGSKQKDLVVSHLVDRFRKCFEEKNHTLIRFDIIQGLSYLYNEVKDIQIKQKALELIETEEQDKYRNKYAKLWS
ncbi:hypothetical protein ACM26V_22450 [Salipaludibacillus sp. HK11]|uniref:hypothetical protein n=1 Tax=Salipaludibacillus sp. HK11 TaxID=3394320 RepID=UPI0039FBA9BE